MQLGARLLATVEGVYIALDAIKSNRIRAALTIMGVALGVFVVVAMGATIHGINQSFKSDLDRRLKDFLLNLSFLIRLE